MCTVCSKRPDVFVVDNVPIIILLCTLIKVCVIRFAKFLTVLLHMLSFCYFRDNTTV